MMIRIPDWVYKYFEERWPEEKRENQNNLGLDSYVSWKISEIIGEEIRKELLKVPERKPEKIKKRGQRPVTFG